MNHRKKKVGVHVPAMIIAPGLVIALIGHFAAPLAGAMYAFTDFKGIGSYNFVGLQNFVEIFSSKQDFRALCNTFKIAIPFVISVIIIGLLLALALQKKLKTVSVLRSLLFIPAVMIPLSISQVWKYILNNDGPLNMFLKAIGHSELCKNWLGDPSTALWCILFVMIWQNAGYSMVIFSAGLESIPKDLYEAASVDGAGAFQRFFYITRPMLAPSITIVVTLMTISGLRVFDQVIGLTGGGPAHWTETLASDFYQQTWVNGRYGYGSALALLLTILVSVIGVLQVVLLARQEEKVNG